MHYMYSVRGTDIHRLQLADLRPGAENAEFKLKHAKDDQDLGAGNFGLGAICSFRSTQEIDRNRITPNYL